MLLNILEGISEVLKIKKKKKKKKNRKRGEGSRKCGVVRCIFEVPTRNRRGRKKKKKRPRLSFGGWKMHMISFL